MHDSASEDTDFLSLALLLWAGSLGCVAPMTACIECVPASTGRTILKETKDCRVDPTPDLTLRFAHVWPGLDLKGKPVAVFGLGDSIGYGEYFCDAMEELYSSFKASGAKMVGHWPADGYQHEDSKVGMLP